MSRNNNRNNLINIIAIPLYVLMHGFMLRAMGTFLTMLARSIVPAYIVPTVGFQIAIPVLAQVIFTKLSLLIENKIYDVAENDPNPAVKILAKGCTVDPRPVRSRFEELYDVPGMVFMLAAANMASPGILANDAKRYAIATAGSFLGFMYNVGARALSRSPEANGAPQPDNNNNATRPILAV